jgi:hypothetical protein
MKGEGHRPSRRFGQANAASVAGDQPLRRSKSHDHLALAQRRSVRRCEQGGDDGEDNAPLDVVSRCRLGDMDGSRSQSRKAFTVHARAARQPSASPVGAAPQCPARHMINPMEEFLTVAEVT